jgi:hypothetical protein
MRHPDRYEIRPRPQRWGYLLQQVLEVSGVCAILLLLYVLYVIAWALFGGAG